MPSPLEAGRIHGLRFWLSTLPASTISLILALCFFHVDSVDWLILNLLQTSTAFKPESNLPSIFYFLLQCSVSMLTLRLWHRHFERKYKEIQSFYIILNAFISHVGDVGDHIKHTLKKYIYFSKQCRRGQRQIRKTTYSTWKTLTVASFFNSK